MNDLNIINEWFEASTISDKYRITVSSADIEIDTTWPVEVITERNNWIKEVLHHIGEDYFINDETLYFRVFDLCFVYKPKVTGNFEKYIEVFNEVYNDICAVLNNDKYYVTVTLAEIEPKTECSLYVDDATLFIDRTDNLEDILTKARLLSYITQSEFEKLTDDYYKQI